MTTSFDSLGLAAPLLDAVQRMGFTTPTPVQARLIPEAIRGGDWLVSSQTGSGKTAAFLLPALTALINQPSAARSSGAEPAVVVLCPTRELAQQVASDAIDLVRGTRGVRVATVMGGMPYGRQIQLLRGAGLVVATPGRLLDLIERHAIGMSQVRCLIVDEADRMLDLGFAEDLQAIDAQCRERAQTMMFSATFAPRIMDLASRLTRNPGRIELAAAGTQNASIAQTLLWADNTEHKLRLLDHLLASPDLDQAVVFASTQIQSEELANMLRDRGVSASALHGAMPQSVRNRRLDALRDGRTRILVATDVAARGIDVPTITHVINFGLPMKAEDYVHRIGRTGRAGRSGVAVTLAEHRERGKIRAIEYFTRQPIRADVIAGLEPREVPRPRRNGPARGAPQGPGSGRWRDSGPGAQAPGRGAPRADFGGADHRAPRPTHRGAGDGGWSGPSTAGRGPRGPGNFGHAPRGSGRGPGNPGRRSPRG